MCCCCRQPVCFLNDVEWCQKLYFSTFFNIQKSLHAISLTGNVILSSFQFLFNNFDYRSGITCLASLAARIPDSRSLAELFCSIPLLSDCPPKKNGSIQQVPKNYMCLRSSNKTLQRLRNRNCSKSRSRAWTKEQILQLTSCSIFFNFLSSIVKYLH